MTPNSTGRAPAMMPHGVPAPVSEPAAPVSEQVARLLAVVDLAGIAVIHVLDAPDTFAGVKYIFWLYIAVIAGATGQVTLVSADRALSQRAEALGAEVARPGWLIDLLEA